MVERSQELAICADEDKEKENWILDTIATKDLDCATNKSLQSKKGSMLEELMNFDTSYRAWEATRKTLPEEWRVNPEILDDLITEKTIRAEC